jgi:uncharacterized phosphosugar-binding protein
MKNEKSALERFEGQVTRLIHEIVELNRESFQAASRAMIERIKVDRLIYVYGTGGHSVINSEESFFRAGGLVQISPVIDAGVSLINGGLYTSVIGRTPGYARSVLKRYNLTPGDLLVIVNAYGMNCISIDAALEAKDRGATVLAITSPAHSDALARDHVARHPTQKNLHEVSDIVIDCRMPFGDAVVEIPGLATKVSPVSTLCTVFVWEALVAQVAEDMVAQGLTPDIWTSLNVPGGDQAIEKYVEKYRSRVRYF